MNIDVLKAFLTSRSSIACCLISNDVSQFDPAVRLVGKLCFCARSGKEEVQCVTCKKIDRMEHPDIAIFKPKGHTYVLDQVKEMKNFAEKTAIETSKKLIFIDKAEVLTYLTSNALLKLTEEPAPDTRIFLFTSSAYLLLPTLASRCFRINIGILKRNVESALKSCLPKKPKNAKEMFTFAKEVSKKQGRGDLVVLSLCGIILRKISRLKGLNGIDLEALLRRVYVLNSHVNDKENRGLNVELGIIEALSILGDIKKWG